MKQYLHCNAEHQGLDKEEVARKQTQKILAR